MKSSEFMTSYCWCCPKIPWKVIGWKRKWNRRWKKNGSKSARCYFQSEWDLGGYEITAGTISKGKAVGDGPGISCHTSQGRYGNDRQKRSNRVEFHQFPPSKNLRTRPKKALQTPIRTYPNTITASTGIKTQM